MILVGAMLAGVSLRSTFRHWRLYIISFLRLLLWPLLVFLVLRLITNDTMLIAVPTLITAMPAAANTALLANEHGADEHLASQAVFVSTLLSILSISLVAALLNA
jgi:predicted permease